MSGLLEIRERALGLGSGHYLSALTDGADTDDEFLATVIRTLPRRSAGAQGAASDTDLEGMMTARKNRVAWRSRLHEMADTGALAAVAAASFDCLYAREPGDTTDSVWRQVAPTWRDAPLLQFTLATCGGTNTERLSALLEGDPRFVEINYFLALGATLHGKLDEADARLQHAFDWRHDWPAVTLAIANTAMTAEDFGRATSFYESTLTLDADNSGAQLGLVRALSYSGRYDEAVGAADRLLATHWHTGDAYYWRAWNEAQLNRTSDAWADVEKAAPLLFNAEVPKLTGIVAVARGDLQRAESEFDEADRREQNDCETLTLLGGTRLELRKWPAASQMLSEAVACLDAHDDELRAEIARLSERTGRERIVAHREQELKTDERLRRQAWFNLAVSAFNQGNADTARTYAERLVDDEHFGPRARQLLERLPK